MTICGETCFDKMVAVLAEKWSCFAHWIRSSTRCTPDNTRILRISCQKSHHHHVVFEPANFSIMSVLEFIYEFAVDWVCLNSFPLFQHDHYLIIRQFPSEAGILYWSRFVRLAHDTVLICLNLEHSDLSASISDQERVAWQVKPYIQRLVGLSLVF